MHQDSRRRSGLVTLLVPVVLAFVGLAVYGLTVAVLTKLALAVLVFSYVRRRRTHRRKSSGSL